MANLLLTSSKPIITFPIHFRQSLLYQSVFSSANMVTTRQTSRASSSRLQGAQEPRQPSKKSKKNEPSIISKVSISASDGTDGVRLDIDISATVKGKKRADRALVSDPSTFLKREDSPWLVGAHVSAAKGVENAVTNAASIGALSFALFLKSQRKWVSPDLTEASILEFKKRMAEFGYSSKMVLPHGSYLINLGNPDIVKREKSFVCFLDDMKRCEALELDLYNFHPGSTVGQATTEESLTYIAECINRAHKETKSVTVVLENMAGAGNIIGSDFAHLAGIIERVEDKSRVGVCIDTCHAFAAGYDIRTNEGWEKTMTMFDETIGIHYLRGMHLNDSKTVLNSKRDRHENIGMGYLGLRAFRHILSDPRTQGIPLILETPSFEQPRDVWGKEIEVLQRISGTEAHRGSTPEYADLERMIDCAVKEAEKQNGGPKSKKIGKTKAVPMKRKRKESISEESTDEHGSDC